MTSPFAPHRRAPVGVSSFVGRRELLEAARHALVAHRLVSLVGPGGVGKTRCAWELATGRAMQVRAFVALEASTGGDALAQRAAAALRLQPSRDEPAAQVADALAHEQSAFVVLDGAEWLDASGRAQLAAWLEAAPAVRWLSTSRMRLDVAHEHVIDVPPLGLPAPGQLDVDAEAMVLMLTRARAAMPELDFTDAELGALGEIVRQLDGLPLAIELVAPRLRVLTPDQLLVRLRRDLSLVSDPERDPRHAALETVLQSSWETLSSDERVALLAIGSLPTSFEVDVAEAVFASLGANVRDALDRLQTLRDRSLVSAHRREDARAYRFSLLETIKAFVQAQSSREDRERALDAHADHFARWAAAGPSLQAVEREMGNLLAAATRLVERLERHDGSAAPVVEIAERLFELAAHGGAGRSDVLALVERLGARLDGEPRETLVRLHLRLAELHRTCGSVERARVHLEQAEQRDDGTLPQALRVRLVIERELMDPACDPSPSLRAVESGAPVGSAPFVRVLAAYRDVIRGSTGLVQLGRDSLEAMRASGVAEIDLALAREKASYMLLDLGEHAACEALARESLARCTKHGLRADAAQALRVLADAALDAGDVGRADTLALEGLALQRALPSQPLLVGYTAALVAFAQKRFEECAVLLEEALRTYRHPLTRAQATALLALARARAGDASAARASVAAVRIDDARSQWAHKTVAFTCAARLVLGERDADTLASFAAARARLRAKIPTAVAARTAIRILEESLDPQALRDASIAASAGSFTVRLDGTCFASIEGRVDLGGQPQLARLLRVLVAARIDTPGHPLSRDELLAAIWPDEKMSAKSASERLRAAVYRLRSAGVRDAILADDAGVRLDPALPLVPLDFADELDAPSRLASEMPA